MQTLTPQSKSARWKTALHEAGHAVACIAMGGRCDGVVILPENAGLAATSELLGDREVFVVAAGPAAESLVDRFGVPSMITQQPALLEIERLPVFQSEPLLASQMAHATNHRFDSDDRGLALWAITGHEDAPESWAPRVEHAKRVATEIVEKHADTIARVASLLFACGSLAREEITNLMETIENGQ